MLRWMQDIPEPSFLTLFFIIILIGSYLSRKSGLDEIYHEAVKTDIDWNALTSGFRFIAHVYKAFFTPDESFSAPV